MLRSVRLVLQLFALGRMGSVVSSCNGVDVQVPSVFSRLTLCVHVHMNIPNVLVLVKRRIAEHV